MTRELEGAAPEAELFGFMRELAATEPDPLLSRPVVAPAPGPARALESAWAQIQACHRELPEVPVAVVPAAQVPIRYLREPVPILRVTWDFLSWGASEVMVALLHEAAHALAAFYGVRDTSRQGRWHNRRFLSLARDVTLRYPWSRPASRSGYGDVVASARTFDRYQSTIEQLAFSLREHRS